MFDPPWVIVFPDRAALESLLALIEVRFSASPGRRVGPKKTSSAGPGSARHCFTRRWAFEAGALVRDHARSTKNSNVAFVSSSGNSSNSSTTLGQSSSSGFARVRRRRGSFISDGRLPPSDISPSLFGSSLPSARPSRCGQAAQKSVVSFPHLGVCDRECDQCVLSNHATTSLTSTQSRPNFRAPRI